MHRADNLKRHGTIGIAADGVLIADAIEGDIFPGGRVAVLFLILEDILKDDVTQQLRFVGAGDNFLLDLLINVPFFVGQEVVQVATAVDERILFQPSEALFNLLLQCQSVGIDLVEA